MTTEVYIRVRASGKVHRAFKDDEGHIYTQERDNLDSAVAYDEVPGTDHVEDADLCKHCFPEPA